MNSLESSAIEHSRFFDNQLNMIPVDYYYPKDNIKLHKNENKYKFNKKGIKLDKNKSNKLAKLVEKKIQNKFDPNNYSSVINIQQAMNNMSKPKKSTSANPLLKKTNNNNININNNNNNNIQNNNDIHSLRKRLQNRIASLKKNKKNKSKKRSNPNNNNNKSINNNNDKDDIDIITTTEIQNNKVTKKRKKEDDDHSKYDFQFNIDKKRDDMGDINNNNKTNTKKLNSKQQLNKLIKEEEYIKSLKPENAKKIKKKKQYNEILDKISGKNIKSSISKLKKSIKKSEKKKLKSKDSWHEREESLKKGIKNKQILRNENLKSRMTKSKKKQSIRIQKEQNRPGFEGNTNGFIN